MTTPAPSTPITPIRKSVTVRRPVDEAFRVFTDEIGEWWPLRTHSVGQEQSETCVMEGRVGGEFYERLKDGQKNVWGNVLVWEPPHRLVYTFHPGRGPETAQEVEMTFTASGDSTRVDLVHSGWEKLGDRAHDVRPNYDKGWDTVLAGAYVAGCERTTA